MVSTFHTPSPLDLRVDPVDAAMEILARAAIDIEFATDVASNELASGAGLGCTGRVLNVTPRRRR